MEVSMKKFSIGTLALALLALLLLAACSSSTTSNRPGWIDQGSGFYAGDKGKAFYGVGAATGIKTAQLRRTTAETNARADLARSFKTRVTDLVKIYMRNVAGGPETKGNEEQVNQQVTKAFTDLELVGVPVINHYYSQGEDTEYALVMMDAATMKEQLSQMKQLSKQVQDQILKNSEDAFKELKEEQAKGKNQ